MMKAKRHTAGARGFARPLSVLTLLIGPLVAASSCSGSGGSIEETLGKESLSQIACGGQASGGTFGRGGISSGGSIIIKGGTGGTGSGTCPSDDCTTFICKEGRCVVDGMKTEGETCVDSFVGDRGRCAGVDWDGDNRPDFTQCCSSGCLDRNMMCVAYAQQSDDQCGRLGSDCTGCSECKTCSASGTCVAAPSGTDCSGGECLGGSCCTGCISGTTCYVDAAANCGSNGGVCTNCDDGKSCTVDKCVGGACEHTNVTGSCDDGDQCTINDSCSGSSCTGTERNCDDGNPCTDDDCDPEDGCTHDPAPGSCNDGDPCTEDDSCTETGACAGTPVVCDDGNQCTDDSCTPGGCMYTSKPEGETCSDGAACSTGDRCHDDDSDPDTARVCEPTGGPNCEDGNPCTSDAADCTTMTCPHDPVNDGDPCSTGTLCEVGQSCMAGVCGGGTPLVCNDDNDCTSDACDDTQGCLHTPSNDGESCVTPDHCFTDKVCDNGACVGEPVECVIDNECLEADECEPSDGTCHFSSKPNGTSCGRTGMCQSGACEGDGVVDPQGGTGPGGGGPGGGDTGGTSAAGEGSGDTGGGGNSGAGADQTPLYKRDPGGCACRLPAPASRHDAGALAALVALALIARRRRRDLG